MIPASAIAMLRERCVEPPWVHASSLADALEEVLAQARATWPSLQLPPERFVARLTTVLELSSPSPGTLAEVRPLEQALVAACLDKAAGALEVLEQYARRGLSAVSRQFAGVLTEDELLQRVQERLLVPAAGMPRLAAFTGQTGLERWIRIMGLRIGLDAVRSDRRRDARQRAFPQALPQRDPEFYWMRQLYTAEFEEILLRSLASLPTRDRNILRAQVVHEMTLDEMATLWGVHRATIARWLRSSRLRLLEHVHAGLRDDAGLSDSEVESVLALIQSGVSEGVIVRGLREGASLEPPKGP